MRFIIGLLSILAVLIGPAHAQDLSDEQYDEAIRFAQNNTIFVLYHEFGHLAISQFGLPILGKEEDAADNIASVILLSERKEEFDNILIDAADGWYLSDLSNTSDFVESDFYGSHSLDIQRSYQIVCLMAGQSLETFGEFAAEYGLDEDRIDLCGVDYEQLERSWAVMTEAFIDPLRGKGHTARIVYDEPTAETELSATIIKQSGMMEELQQRFAETLPEATTFRATSCDEQNAFYDPENVEIVMCYELTDLFLDLVIEDMLAEE
ncbi:DUF4344 domain-containing metallopeptidase [Maritalea mediterranea]|uniref:DUF4344 domain-containing metallopeptidase n=1 Tax=Maritalea mediterranea TaxID=2909667 RepID=A0ABS9E872_9HYPH|nr:DUF4344 domain-containing metallopeptidase [Maritalea mediterranea]MCF4098099.1 DUF4344 domain-containing metallopeptidase [Maritalea mediterranea]